MSHDAVADPILQHAETVVRQWRAAHPRATFAELEAILDEELRAARAALLAAVAPAVPVGTPPNCTHCGGAMVWRGTHERTLRTDGDHPVPLRRAYAHCPTCGSGLFPPGSDA